MILRTLQAALWFWLYPATAMTTTTTTTPTITGCLKTRWRDPQKGAESLVCVHQTLPNASASQVELDISCIADAVLKSLEDVHNRHAGICEAAAEHKEVLLLHPEWQFSIRPCVWQIPFWSQLRSQFRHRTIHHKPETQNSQRYIQHPKLETVNPAGTPDPTPYQTSLLANPCPS